MITALTTMYFGLEVWKWIVLAVVLCTFVIGLAKKLFKLAITVVVLCLVYYLLTSVGII